MKNTNTNATEDVDIVVNNFLEALETKNYSVISNLLAEDIVYKNVSLPTFKGKKLVNTLLKFAFSNGLDLQVKNLNIAVNGNVVLTERIDVVVIGPLHAGFWVCGTFEVEKALLHKPIGKGFFSDIIFK